MAKQSKLTVRRLKHYNGYPLTYAAQSFRLYLVTITEDIVYRNTIKKTSVKIHSGTKLYLNVRELRTLGLLRAETMLGFEGARSYIDGKECLGFTYPTADKPGRLAEFSVGVLLEHATNFDNYDGRTWENGIIYNLGDCVSHYGQLGVEYVPYDE